MSKVVCDICGTAYEDTVSSCPTCGWANNGGSSVESDDFDDMDFLPEEEIDEVEAPVPAPRSGRNGKDKKVFDFDAVNEDKEPEDDEDEEEESEDEDEDEDEEEESGSNTLLVVILVVLIVALLLVSGFIFWKYYLPNHKGSDDNKPQASTGEVIEQPEITELPTVPCTGLSLITGMETLTSEGQNWLLHVMAAPEDTTDTITFASLDESVAVVNEEGRVTAVAEGETKVIITCGDQTIECPVVVSYQELPEVTEEVPNFGESEEPTEEAVEVPPVTAAPDVVLKLKKTDISLFARYTSTTLQLDCDLTYDQIEWSVGNSAVAIVKNGEVTAVGPGITHVYAKYGDQVWDVIVRCSF